MPIDHSQSSVSCLLRFESNLNDVSTNRIVFTQPGGALAYDTTTPKWGAGSMVGSGNTSGKYASTTMTANGVLDILSTAEFTVEFWLYLGNDAGVSQLIDYGNWVGGAHGFGIYRSTDTLSVQPAAGWGTTLQAISLSVNTWHHVALVRSGAVVTLYVDGTQRDTKSDWTLHAAYTDTIRIGADSNSGGNSDYMHAVDKMDELRITKGVARYTGNFSVPTTAFPFLPHTSTTYPTSVVDPNYWSDGVSVPPASYSAVTDNYTFAAAAGQAGEIAYIGDYSNRLPSTLYLDWAFSGNTTRDPILLYYSKDYGVTYTSVDIGTGVAAGNSELAIATAGATLISFYVSGANAVNVTVSTRTVEQNCLCTDTTNLDTLINLRQRMLRRLGFSAMVNTPPPGMTELLNEFLYSAQRFLYRKYSELRTKRFFNWQMSPGTRFYCYNGNTEDMAGLHLDPYKDLDYVGVVLTNGAWIPLYEGIPPTVYTMVSKQGIPARYERRQCIEVFPAPNDYYQLVVKGHFGLQAFAADSDYTTIDSEAVFLYALATAKAHYSNPDAATTAGLAKDYIAQLVAGGHGRTRYIPGTVPTVPAVQPVFLPLINP